MSTATLQPGALTALLARHRRAIFISAFCLALLARIPFYATHHIQEDSYITFRSAFHLADFHDYSFNLGDHSSGVTSTLYGPMVAAARLVFSSHAIAALSVLNTVLFLAGAMFLAFALFLDSRERLLFFIAIAMLPVGLLISYAGMEIPLQVAAFCAALFTLRHGKVTPATFVCVLLLPLIRPDAIAYSLILAALAFSFDKARGLLAAGFSFAGTLLVLVFNRLITGRFITATMRAKEVAYHPQHGLRPLLHNAKILLVTRSYLLPVEAKELERLSPLVTLLVLGACAAALWMSRRETITFRLLLACFAAGVLIPGAYAFGGVIFPWYLWTCNWLSFALACYAAVRIASRSPVGTQRLVIAALAAIWIACGSMQWLVSCNIGLQEYHYRADVGRWLHLNAKPTDTLELEPAGYIPFYAGLRTYDEIGLVSPQVLDYRTHYGPAWWIEFLKQEHPDWLVERGHLAHHITIDGVHLSAADASWFDSHYTLVRRFHYSAANYVRSGWLLRIMRNGTHDDYYVYHYSGAP